MTGLDPTTHPGPIGFLKLAPGSYVVWRRFDLAGALHARQVVCANPAYGVRLLGGWESVLRAEVKAQSEGQV